MADLAHAVGGDLGVGPTGDLALARSNELGRQRVLRRLLTNPGDYVWHLDYGAGLARFIGQPLEAPRINSLIRSQMLRESSVARTPAPTLAIRQDSAAAFSAIDVTIAYVDTTTDDRQSLALSLGR